MATRALRAAAALALAGLLAGCGSATGNGTGFSGIVPAAQRAPAPVLAGPKLGGGFLSLAQDRGHVVVVNFWASWCGPCKSETTALVAAAAQTASLGVRFVGIDVTDSTAQAVKFRAAHHVTYPSLVDKQGTWLARFRGLPAALPDTVLLDARGRVAGTWIGAVQRAGLVSELRTLAGEA